MHFIDLIGNTLVLLDSVVVSKVGTSINCTSTEMGTSINCTSTEMGTSINHTSYIRLGCQLV